MGSTKVPAATVVADVTIVFGNFKETRLSHGAAVAGDALNATSASSADKQTKATQFGLLMNTTSPPTNCIHVRMIELPLIRA